MPNQLAMCAYGLHTGGTGEARVVMASIWQDRRSGNWLIKFVYGGKPFCKSCLTQDSDDAGRIKARVEETLGMLNTGRLTLPEDADPGVWILSGGKLQEKPKLDTTSPASVAAICDAYYNDQLDKADTTLEAEKRHIGHLKRALGEKTAMASLTLETMQNYINVRSKAGNRYGGTISGRTIRRNLPRSCKSGIGRGNAAISSGLARSKNASRPHKWAVKIPKQDETEGFMTWDEIERRIARGGLTSQQEKNLWKFLYLDEKQVAELLKHVEKNCRSLLHLPHVRSCCLYGGKAQRDLPFDDRRF